LSATAAPAPRVAWSTIIAARATSHVDPPTSLPEPVVSSEARSDSAPTTTTTAAPAEGFFASLLAAKPATASSTNSGFLSRLEGADATQLIQQEIDKAKEYSASFLSSAERAPVVSALPRLLRNRYALPCCLVFLPTRELARTARICSDFARAVKEPASWRFTSLITSPTSRYISSMPPWQRVLLRSFTISDSYVKDQVLSGVFSFVGVDTLREATPEDFRGFERLEEFKLDTRHWASALRTVKALFLPQPESSHPTSTSVMVASSFTSAATAAVVASATSKPLRTLHLHVKHGAQDMHEFLPIFQSARLQQLRELSLTGNIDTYWNLESILTLPSLIANLTSLTLRHLLAPADAKGDALVEALAGLQSLTAFTLLSLAADGADVSQRALRTLHRLRLPPSVEAMSFGETAVEKRSKKERAPTWNMCDLSWIHEVIGTAKNLTEFSLVIEPSFHETDLKKILRALQVNTTLRKVQLRGLHFASRSVSACLRGLIRENASRLTPHVMALIAATDEADGESHVAVSAIELSRPQQRAASKRADGWEEDAMQLDATEVSSDVVDTFVQLMASFSPTDSSAAAASSATLPSSSAALASTSPLFVGPEELTDLTDLSLLNVPLSVGFLTPLAATPLPRLQRLHVEATEPLFDCEEDLRAFWTAIGAHGATLEALTVQSRGDFISLNDTTDGAALAKLTHMKKLLLDVDGHRDATDAQSRVVRPAQRGRNLEKRRIAKKG
jgi:hypothetical protein